MAEFVDVVMSRRMTRAFSSRPIPHGIIERFVTLANRAPSAGKTQGWHLVVLEGDDTARFWDVTLPVGGRSRFKWQQLLDAPVIALPLADPKAYLDRYGEPDKVATGLSAGTDAWPVPYWTIDASMAVMTILLAAENEGLGALFFGVFKGERELRHSLGIPSGLELLGAIALGYPASDDRRTSAGRSAARPARSPEHIIRRGGWNAAPSRPAPVDR